MFNELLADDFDKLNSILKSKFNIDLNAIASPVDDTVNESLGDDTSSYIKSRYNVDETKLNAAKSTILNLVNTYLTPSEIYKETKHEKLAKTGGYYAFKFGGDIIRLKDIPLGIKNVDIEHVHSKLKKEAVAEKRRILNTEKPYSTLYRLSKRINKVLNSPFSQESVDEILKMVKRINVDIKVNVSNDSKKLELVVKKLNNLFDETVKFNVANSIRVDMDENTIQYAVDLLQKGDKYYDWYNKYNDDVRKHILDDQDSTLFLCLTAITSPKTALGENIRTAALLYNAIIRDKKIGVLADISKLGSIPKLNIPQLVSISIKSARRDVILNSEQFKRIDLTSFPPDVISGKTDNILNNIQFDTLEQIEQVKLKDGTLISDLPKSDRNLLRGMLFAFKRAPDGVSVTNDVDVDSGEDLDDNFAFRSSYELFGSGKSTLSNIGTDSDGNPIKISQEYYKELNDFFVKNSTKINSKANEIIAKKANELSGVDFKNFSKSTLLKVMTSSYYTIPTLYTGNLMKIIRQYLSGKFQRTFIVDLMKNSWDGIKKFNAKGKLVSGAKVFSFTLNLLDPTYELLKDWSPITVDTWMLAFFFPSLKKKEQEAMLKIPDAYTDLQQVTLKLTDVYNNMREKAYNERKKIAKRNREPFTENFVKYNGLQFQAVVWCAAIANSKRGANYTYTFEQGVEQVLQSTMAKMKEKLDDTREVSKSIMDIKKYATILDDISSSDANYMQKIDKVADAIINSLITERAESYVKNLIREIIKSF